MCGKAIFEGIVTGVCMAHERHLHGSRATLVRLASRASVQQMDCKCRSRGEHASEKSLSEEGFGKHVSPFTLCCPEIG